MLAALLAAALTPQDVGDSPTITIWPGDVIEGAIKDGSPVVETDTLRANYTQAPTVGKSFRLRVAQSGPYHIDLRSYFFDAYLVLRNVEGVPLAEDDDGLFGLHSRIIGELEPDTVYVLEVCALHGRRGPFRLQLVAGLPPTMSDSERAAEELEDAEQRVAALETTRGPERTALAAALNDLGSLLRERSRYDLARHQYERALAIREEVLGPDHLDTATSLNNLGVLLKIQGEYEDARRLYERALEVKERALGSDHLSTVAILSNLGGLLHAQGDYSAVRPFLERALAVREKALGSHHPQVATSLHNLGVLLEVQGDHAGARRMYERSLAIIESALGPDHPAVARSLDSLTSILLTEGKYAEAQLLAERALATNERTLGLENAATARSLNALAVLQKLRGEYAAAQGSYERALAITEKALGSDHPDTAQILTNLALIRKLLGDTAAAQRLLEHALEVHEKSLGRDHPVTAVSLRNLAGFLFEKGDYTASQQAYERALNIQEVALGPTHVETARTMRRLGMIHTANGNYSAARPLFERVLAIREEFLGEQHVDTARSLTDVASLHWSEGRPEAARSLLERAESIVAQTLGIEHPDTARCTQNLVMLLADMGETHAALMMAVGAYSRHRGHLHRTLMSLTEAEGFEYLAQLRWQIGLLLSLRDEIGVADDITAYEAVLSWKGVVSRLLMASRSKLAAGMSPEQAQRVAQLRSVRGQLLTLSRSMNASNSERVKTDLHQLMAERERLERELLQLIDSPEVPAVSSWNKIRASLPNNSAVVDLFAQEAVYRPAKSLDGRPVARGSWIEPRFGAWITVSSSDQLTYVDLGQVDVIEAAVRDHLDDLLSPNQGGKTGRTSPSLVNDRLRQLIWDPVKDYLDGIDLVFVSPDGVLGAFPFEILRDESGRFLIEEYSFVYLTDSSSLGHIRRNDDAHARSLLSVGGVDYDKRASGWEQSEETAMGRILAPATLAEESRTKTSNLSTLVRGGLAEQWESLHASASESQYVVDLHGDAFGTSAERLLLQNDQATEERLKREMCRHNVLHLATHGYFQPEGIRSIWQSAVERSGESLRILSEEHTQLSGQYPGMLSGLVCSGANAAVRDGEEDAYLTAEEVEWLNLEDVDLVVLSACETGLGRPQSGEGLIGLRRAFLMAGAESVICSLWQVEDESTAELMKAFYKNLWIKGLGKQQSLRLAQLELLDRNRKGYDDPQVHTWGGFVLTGDWR